MKNKMKLMKSLLSCFMTVLIILALTPTGVFGSATYTVHALSDLSNSDALYSDYVKNHHLQFGYITNLTSPVWKVTNSDFQTVSNGAFTYLYTSPNKIPTQDGVAHAAVWKNVAQITYKNAGYYGDNKNNTFDIVFTLTKVMTLKPQWNIPELSTAQYYTVAYTNNSTGVISSNSYTRKSDFDKTVGDIGPFTIEDWTIRVTDSSGRLLTDVLIAQTYRDIDIAHNSNDSSFSSFNEGFCFVNGYIDDTYVTRDSTLIVTDMNGKSNARYESGLEYGDSLESDDERGWVVAAICGGEASLQWTGQVCGSYIANTVFKNYPPLPEPKKRADKEYVKPNDEVVFTVSEDFPEINPSNAAKAVTFMDTVDDHLTIGSEIVITHEGNDVTDGFTIEIDGQTVYARAKDPSTIEGSYEFKIPTRVRDESLDGKTLVLREEETYAVIPNKAYITVRDQYDKDICLETNEIKIYEKGSSIEVTKDVDRTNIDQASEGDTLSYTFIIKNTGKLTLHDVGLSDSLPIRDMTIDWEKSTDKNTGEGILSPGETVIGSAFYDLTGPDLTAGRVVNTVTVTGTDPKGSSVTDDDDAETTVKTVPAISLSKTADPNKMTDPAMGDIISYDFVITNTGSVSLSDFVFHDDHELTELTFSVADLHEAVLPSGGTITGHASYRLTANDIDTGTVINKADITAVSGDGTSVSDQAEDTTVIETTPGILLTKSTPKAVLTDVGEGDEVEWEFIVKNTGKNTLANVFIIDHLEGVSEISYDWAASSDDATGDGVLAPGETVPACASYELTANDIITKSITNTATAHGTSPNGTEVTSDANAKLKIKYDPALTIEKEADVTDYSGAKAGDVITYTLSLTNSGNIDLINVELVDLKEGTSVSDYEWPTREGFLAVGETVTAKAYYTLTQDDIDVTTLNNEAEGKGQAPDGTWVNAQIPNIITKEMHPAITLVKDVDIDEIPAAAAGRTLTYTVTVTNTGDVTLHDVNLADSKSDMLHDVTYVPETTELAPSESFVMTAKYDITQEDINSGSVVNTAKVTAKDPQEGEVSDEDDVQTILKQVSSDAVTKKASMTKIASTEAKVGYEIRYDFTASNTGNTTLHDVSFSDEMLEKAGVAITWEWNQEGILLPDETISGHAIYVLTEEDINAGKVENAVIMNAKDPSDIPLDPAEANVVTIVEKAPAHTVRKTADREMISKAAVGDAIVYTFTYSNSGNTAIHEIEFADTMLHDAGIKIDWDWSGTVSGGEKAILYPGEAITGRAVYGITQEDIDNGKVTNMIVVNAKDPDGNPLPPASGEVTTRILQTSKLSVKKSVDKTSLSNPSAGTVLTYTFKIANEGSTSLSDISLSDSLTGRGLSEITYKYPDETKTLLPGKTMTATATYRLTESDLTARKVENSVIAKGKDPLKKEITSDRSTVTTTIVIPAKPTVTATPTPTISPTPQIRYSTQTATSPKTGDDMLGILASLLVVLTSPGILIVLLRKYKFL